MEIISEAGAFARYAASRLRHEHFTLLDVGCSGGIDAAWRVFGEKLQAVGFDPNIEEVERLNSVETAPHVRYEAGFVGVPDADPIVLKRGGKSYFGRNPWGRLAVARTIQITAKQTAAATSQEKTAVNAWQQTKLAEDRHIHLPAYIKENNLKSVDFVKIDIDGGDFDVLQSLSGVFTDQQVLGAGLEVNFFGSDDPTEHTFHNTDRFMRAHGFALAALTTRPYAMAALPQRYALPIPAQSTRGIPFQGDALYVRDLDERYGSEKLLKLSVLFSLAGLQDCAADVLVTCRSTINWLIDVDQALDLLAAETEIGREHGLNYRQMMEEFERDSRLFYTV
ncbi:FkbM family methyltransferase [Microvirga brassicacearum]|nr:FkbM family methyltransferase [Microvirga brassicacearum]